MKNIASVSYSVKEAVSFSLSLGKYKSGKEIYNELKEKRYSTSNSGSTLQGLSSQKNILEYEEFNLSTDKGSLELVMTSPKILGINCGNTWDTGATAKELISTATTQGLVLCPPETGGILALKFHLWEQKEWYVFTEVPFTGIGNLGECSIFKLYHPGQVGIKNFNYLGNHWKFSPNQPLIFRKLITKEKSKQRVSEQQ